MTAPQGSSRNSYLLAAAAAVLLIAAAGPALASPEDWYGAIDLGYDWREDFTARSGGLAPDGLPYRFDVSTQDDWVGYVRLGYRLNDNVRLELEGGYRAGDIDSAVGGARTPPSSQALCTPGVIRGPSTPCGSPSGSLDQITAMANLIYDFGDADQTFRPFIGAGVGVDRISLDMLGQFSTSPAGPSPANLSIHDAETVFAWQVLAGFAWAISDRLSLDMTARYLDHSEVTFDSVSSSADPAWTPGAFTGDFNDTTVSIGVRYAFGAAEPPPPAPTPAPAVVPPPPIIQPPPSPPQSQPARPRDFTVLFDWDRYDLTPQARQVVREAAAYSRSGGFARIAVVGHADTSGSAAYNLRLSERRAAAVRDVLIAEGVAGSAVTAEGRGETDLARATADGVREPLNRRATIGLSR